MGSFLGNVIVEEYYPNVSFMDGSGGGNSSTGGTPNPQAGNPNSLAEQRRVVETLILKLEVHEVGVLLPRRGSLESPTLNPAPQAGNPTPLLVIILPTLFIYLVIILNVEIIILTTRTLFNGYNDNVANGLERLDFSEYLPYTGYGF
jgi:hypothetical protein